MRRRLFQAHPDPSLGRLRPRAMGRRTVLVEDQERDLIWIEDHLQPVEPGPVELGPRSRDWVRTIDRILVVAIVFAAAVWFVSRLIADATCGV